VSNAEALGFLPPEVCAIERRVFRDPAVEQEFEDRGYVVVPFVDADVVADLFGHYTTAAQASETGVNPPGAYNDTYAEFSIIHSRPDWRREAFDRITDRLGPRADELLADYRPLLANYVNKPPGTGVVPVHQNLAVVDESRFRSVSVWVALVDCVVENGAMWVLDGSHRSLRGRRGLWAYRSLVAAEEELRDHMTPIAVPAGTAVILDDALIHLSPPNVTTECRLAIQLVMVPEEAETIWHQEVGGDGEQVDVDVWRVEPGYFHDMWQGAGDERFGERIDHLTLPAPSLDLEALRSVDPDLARPSGPPTAGPSAPPAPGATVPAPSVPTGAVAEADPSPRRLRWPFRARRRAEAGPDLRRTFVDDERQAALDADGFVVVPLLDEAAVRSLWSAYEGLAHRQTRDSPFAEGFHTSIYDERTAYREAVHAALAATVAPALDRILDRHRMIFANYTVKMAGGGAVPCHPDWTFVDEGRFRSVTVWCALDDIDEGLGSLGVVPGSHREVDFVRPLNVRSYERYDAIAARHDDAVPLRLRAGEAVVMDSRALHASPPNRSVRDRVVAACVAVPEEAAGTHYFVDGEVVWRHAIDPRFYLHYRPGADPDGVPGAGPRQAAGDVAYS
jgi:ectoine hydroxylase-related dioxygenase (phytanoyl-CoA dioxygenase family)